LFQTAFGLKGLGLPLTGLRGNVDNLIASTIQRFQLENIDPSRIVVCASGVDFHQEFADLAEEKLSVIPSRIVFYLTKVTG
jgi:processing peptidase subunit beta